MNSQNFRFNAELTSVSLKLRLLITVPTRTVLEFSKVVGENAQDINVIEGKHIQKNMHISEYKQRGNESIVFLPSSSFFYIRLIFVVADNITNI